MQSDSSKLPVLNKAVLTYQSVTFRKNDSSRFIGIAPLQAGWNQLEVLPRNVDVTSISLVDPDSNLSLLRKGYRQYNDTMTPSMPTPVKVTQANINYTGLLVKKEGNSISVLTNDGLLEITEPYILRYTECLAGQCEVIVPRVNLFLENQQDPASLTTTPSELTFESTGFSWEAVYKASLDLDRQTLKVLSCDISCVNQTELSLINVNASFLAKPDENRYHMRSRSLMAQASMASNFSSQQTTAGSAIYSLDQKIDLPEKSQSVFNLVRFVNIPILTEIRFDILSKPKHPNTIVKFVVPQEMVDGIPAGEVECWDGRTWLANSNIPMSAPRDTVTLFLGENAFINIQTGIISSLMQEEVTVDDDGTEYKIRRTSYIITVRIKNNSQRTVQVYPYQTYERKIKSLKIENQSSNSPPIMLTMITASDNDDLGNRLQFNLPELAPQDEFVFAYSAII